MKLIRVNASWSEGFHTSEDIVFSPLHITLAQMAFRLDREFPDNECVKLILGSSVYYLSMTVDDFCKLIGDVVDGRQATSSDPSDTHSEPSQPG